LCLEFKTIPLLKNTVWQKELLPKAIYV